MALMIIPNKDLFIVTSAIRTGIGVIDENTRLDQTIDGLKSLKKYAPDAIIMLVDASSKPIPEHTVHTLSQLCNRTIMFNGDEDLMTLADAGLKSQADIALLFNPMNALKFHPELQKMMASVRRVFKLSGRTNIIEGYNPSDYDNLFGKYVFKKRMASWLPQELQFKSNCDHLLITRMYSFCTSLMDDYFNTLPQIYNTVNQYGVDTEHAHFGNIKKEHLIEFDNLYCEGVLAGNGQIERY
jgi:hypothetical protein